MLAGGERLLRVDLAAREGTAEGFLAALRGLALAGASG